MNINICLFLIIIITVSSVNTKKLQTKEEFKHVNNCPLPKCTAQEILADKPCKCCQDFFSIPETCERLNYNEVGNGEQ